MYRSTELWPTDVPRTGPLYEQVGQPAGLEYVLGVILENSPAFFTNMAFMQAGVDFSETDKDALRALVPHLQATLQIGRRIALGDAGRHEALLSFERAHQAMVVLDRSGYRLYSNDSANRILTSAAGISIRHGRFMFDSVTVQGEFERLVRLALTAQGAEIGSVPGEVLVPRPAGGPPYGLSVLPVYRSSDRALLPDGAGCMVLIHDLAGLSPLPQRRLASAYGLTTAELRICESLYRTGSVETTAANLCLARNTVRSHLKSIYTKVGVGSQGQLMLRLANSVRFIEALTDMAHD